ncbi:MAG: hypothetical protein KFF73_13575 [Cyclobacteriaceae bacterium]|nr:hypothetical protein [Cyclobacteriaceae bacterium]
MTPTEEKKNRRIGWMISIGLHSLLLLLFFLMLAWREPDPPVPEYGIELNFGIDESGSRAIQPRQPTRVPEEPVEQETEPQDQEPQEETSPPVIEEQEILNEESIEEPVETQPLESPHVVEPPVTTPEIKKEEIREVKEETQEEQVSTEPEVTQSRETTGTTEEVLGEEKATSQGDDAAVEGDEGDEKGTIDSRALYGSQGGGGGPMLELSGWIWDFEPNPQDTSNENGKIVFEIKIADRGEIISVRTLEKTVGPAIERIYQQEVESLTFSPISSNTRPAAVSTGKITFIIRSK